MVKLAFTKSDIMKLDPCSLEHIEKKFGFILSVGWTSGLISIDAKRARKYNVSLYNLIWVAQQLASKDAEIARRLRMFAADCTAHILHIFESKFPNEDRPRKAILAARGGDWEEMKLVRRDALNAWSDTHSTLYDSAACSVALAAYYCCNLVIDNVIFDSIYEASFNCNFHEERKWQYDRFVEWFSKNPPEPYKI